MIKTSYRLLTIGLLAAMAIGAPMSVQAAAKAAAAAKAKPEKPVKATNTAGTIAAVDTIKKTITISVKDKKQDFEVTSGTLFFKEGKAATLSDMTVGNKVVIRAQAKGNKNEAINVKLGAPPKATKATKALTKATKPAKAKKAPTPLAPTTPTTPATATTPPVK